MGRETRILLALLGLLVGVFLGVVSLKLFVPRPPAGAGPDVHANIASVEAQDLVDPPDLVPPAGAIPPAADSYASRTSRFAASEPADLPPVDPFVRPASFEALSEPEPHAEQQPADLMAEPADPLPPPSSAPGDLSGPTSDLMPGSSAPLAAPFPAPAPAMNPPAAAFELAATDEPAAAQGGLHVAQPGDSWWSLAERAYGDGRLYRALFAWNRAFDPRVSLAPGTRLEIPPADRLAAAWPGLVPQD